MMVDVLKVFWRPFHTLFQLSEHSQNRQKTVPIVIPPFKNVFDHSLMATCICHILQSPKSQWYNDLFYFGECAALWWQMTQLIPYVTLSLLVVDNKKLN